MIYKKLFNKSAWCLGVVIACSLVAPQLAAVTPAQDPLFLSQPVRPLMMLNMSNDHQLFFKLYDDYSDLTGDGVPDTEYDNDYKYFGYFNSEMCYEYAGGEFSPAEELGNDGYCNTGTRSGEWSGNFLNWATMTRMDAVRKILYGGQRSTDTSSKTVLERAFLPNDSHSFAKFYNGSNVSGLVPFTATSGLSNTRETGITICNTTSATGWSQNATQPPLLRIVSGNYSLWANNERFQCRWRDNVSGGQGVNDNDPDLTGIYAYSHSPWKSVALGDGDYSVRVSVCEPGKEEEGCVRYPDGNSKPTGLLQEYGEDRSILFGLMTGSYGRNKSGGVLRKNIGDMKDEINVDTDGSFKDAPSSGNIIGTLEKLRIYGYSFDSGEYSGGDNSDNCPFGLTGFDDGQCSNWGNPQSEIFLESLRYFAGASANPDFVFDDSSYISGLVTAEWSDPVSNENYCAPQSVIHFNASISSFDSDVPGIADISLSSVAQWVDDIGAAEGIHGNDYFIGTSGDAQDELCTPKTISSLSDAGGTCPDAPRLGGTYNIAGLAYYARREGVRSTPDGVGTIRTYGVALSSATPSISVPVPGSNDGVVNILPACQNQRTDSAGNSEGNCAIVDFKIVSQSTSATERSGSIYINWEAAEQGGDYDSDMWGILNYRVTASEVEITTKVMQQSSGRPLGFGYILSGTKTDGYHVHSGINNYTYSSQYEEYQTCSGSGDCTCRSGGGSGVCNIAGETTHTYSVGASEASSLEHPLYYAAKWGGYADDNLTESAIADFNPEGDSYFFATDPRELEESLGQAFARVAAGVGSAASVATESTSLEMGDYIFQAQFNSETWSGELLAFEIGEGGSISETAAYSTDNTLLTSEGTHSRRVFTVGASGDIVDFSWNDLSDAQRDALNDGDGRGQDRLDWLRGDRSNENPSGGMRVRNNNVLLGDIVNSSPVYVGGRDRGYGQLEGDAGNDYAEYLETKQAQPATLFVGANDGMLHAFDVENNMLNELFAYVPGGVYDKLANLTRPTYGRADNPHQYTVDGPLAAGDAYIGGSWRSVVVGTLGAGGKGVFALDVTDRNDPKVLFEISGAEWDELGYVLGQPMIARMATGRWAVLFGNGYDSSDGTSKLMVVDLEDPAKGNQGETNIIDTEAGTGLSAISLLGDSYGRVRWAYAGDLRGNLWKFDLDNSNTVQWEVAFGGDPMFSARDDQNNVQPITGAPTLGRNRQKDNAIMVYFGTGKYFEIQDNNANERPQQSFYGLADTNQAYIGDRDDFLNQRYITDGTDTRVVNSYADLDWSSHDGWYLDFNTRAGERVVNKPLLLFDRLIFPTVIPSAVACQFGGQSWLMDLPATGSRFVNGGLLSENILSDSLILGDPSYGVVDRETGALIISSSDGSLGQEMLDIPAGALGRQSWRQLR